MSHVTHLPFSLSPVLIFSPPPAYNLPMPQSPEQSVSDYTDASRGERLHKVMAAAGVASRRQCEKLIELGLVSVNGETIQSLPAWVDPVNDLIRVEGRPLPRRKNEQRTPSDFVYVLLHKPRGVITTTEDPQGRRHVTDLVDMPAPKRDAAKPRLYPVGRLDADSSGLILLTNDGDLANRLTHPRYEVPKQYHVSVRGRVQEEDIERLKSGLVLAHRGTKDRPAKPRRAAVSDVKLLGHQHDRDHGDRTKLLLTLHEGQNREIRRLLARLDFKVRRLRRISIGPLKLKGLAVGQWRKLTSAEARRLCKVVGLKR